jgi:hypothetical protein
MNSDISATTDQQRRSRAGLERSKRKLCNQFSIPEKCFGGAHSPVAGECVRFQIETCTDRKTWNDTGWKGPKASDLLIAARKLADSDSKLGVRIIRPGGSRAVHCFNFKKR